MYTKKENEALELYLKSIKYDYALLRLKSPIKRDRFPLLVPDFRKEGK